MIPPYILIPVAAIIMLVAAFGAYCFKRASKTFSLHPLKLIRNWWFILGAATYTLGSIAYVVLLKFEDLSIVYPLASIQYIWVALLSATLLKEHVGREKIFGITLIILGVIIITAFR